MRSREVHWADLPPPYGRRPVCVLTRNAALPVLKGVTVAPITTIIREIASEVPVGRDEGLAHQSVINCDNLITISGRRIDTEPVGTLSYAKCQQLDRALRFSLAIRG